MTNTKEKAENELRQLIKKARKLFANEFDTCFDWIDGELKKAKQISEQIEKIQRQIPELDSKLFNESRDCCQELLDWQKRLNQKRKDLLDCEQNKLVKTLDELGSVNDGFQRSRKILCNK